jgi:hypothetical protein
MIKYFLICISVISFIAMAKDGQAIAIPLPRATPDEEKKN